VSGLATAAVVTKSGAKVGLCCAVPNRDRAYIGRLTWPRSAVVCFRLESAFGGEPVESFNEIGKVFKDYGVEVWVKVGGGESAGALDGSVSFAEVGFSCHGAPRCLAA